MVKALIARVDGCMCCGGNSGRSAVQLEHHAFLGVDAEAIADKSPNGIQNGNSMSDLHVEFSPAIEVGNGASSPGEGDQQDQGLEVFEVVEMELVYQGCKEGLDFFGELDDLNIPAISFGYIVFLIPLSKRLCFLLSESRIP